MIKKTFFWVALVTTTVILTNSQVYTQINPLPVPVLPPCSSCDSDTTGWRRASGSIENLCCIDADRDGRYHCAQCILDKYEKVINGRLYVKYAGPHSCRAVQPLMRCL